MSKEYQETSWTGDDTTINETYLSAGSPGNSTQYFSMLEDTTLHDDNADTTVQLETSLDETSTEAVNDDVAALLQEPDRVVLYRIQGSDDMYAVQVAEDENGKLQKYQFKVRPTADGQYEAVQETITVIPFDASDPIIPSMLDEPTTVETMTTSEDSNEQRMHVKCEQLVVSNEQHQLTAVDSEDGGEEYGEGNGTVLGTVGRLEMDEYQYEESNIADTKEGILHLQSMNISNEESPSNHELKIEYYHDHDSNSNTADEDQNHLHSIDDTQEQQESNSDHSPLTDENSALERKVILKEQRQVVEEGDSPDEDALYSQLNHDDIDDHGSTEMLTDGIEYVGVEEPDYDGSIVDESTQLEHEEEDDQQINEDSNTMAEVEPDIHTDEEEEDTEYIIATGMEDGEMTEGNGDIEYQQIIVTNNHMKTSALNHSPTAIKTYLDATQLQQLTLAAATSNNNQLPPNAAYIVTKIINENQSITTTATSIDQGVKLVRSLKIKRIETPQPNNMNHAAPSVAAILIPPNHNSPLNNSSSSRVVEKENVSNVNTNVISNMLKPNPRSILKASHVILRKTEQQPEENIDKRFARSKELQRKRMFRDYIAQTTILQAPIRQERLPRKQLIKPVHRTDEEIIVREMVISSTGNGFIETLDEKAKENHITSVNRSYEHLSDSDSDFKPYNSGKRKRKYKKRKQQSPEMQSTEDIESDDSVISSTLQEAIDLSADSEGEEIIETIIINSPGKKRGRPPKPIFDPSLPKRRGRPPKNRRSTYSTPANEETIRIIPSTENKCTLCSKVFPSVGSLRSHMNFHKYMEEKPESKLEQNEQATIHSNVIPENKYSCSKCSSTFKNAILLTKHVEMHDKKDKLECKVCQKVFSDNGQLTTHRKSHIKDYMFQSTQISAQKRTKVSAVSFNCFVCNKLFSSKVLLAAHMKSHKNVFSCGNCGRNFMSKVLLDKHVRLECVKRRSIEMNKRISFVAKPTLHKSVGSSEFAKPNSKLTHHRRTVLRSLSTTSKEEENNHIEHSTTSQNSDYTSQESISSLTSSNTAPASLLTPANSKIALSVAGRFTSSNIKSSGLQLKLKCDECDEVFSAFKLRYKHQVLKHGMYTADTTINMESEKKEKRRFYKPTPGHSGVPANANLAKAFAALQEQIKRI